MIQGVMSNTGKSLITAGLCRIFTQDGYKTAPFKSQNMALNSFITNDGFEIGRAQAVQAECCNKDADIRMNPILLKPTSEKGAQVIINGKPIGNMSAKEYFKYKKKLMPCIMEAFNSLYGENDIIVIEGAGSPAEINLKENDIVNMGIAKATNSPVILIGDIDRGGVFASLYGTVMLLEKSERKFIKSIIINKFRGDKDILQPGIDMLEKIIKITVDGVIPFMDINIDDEDSLSQRLNTKNKNCLIDIAVIRLPHISNFTDFIPFENIDGVGIRYISSIYDFGNPDLIIIPGTKNTISDLLWLRQCGIENCILKANDKNTAIIGICGGYQMLGVSISDPFNTESGKCVSGIGLLECETIFDNNKVTKRIKNKFGNIDGMFSSLSNLKFEGYEIHMGRTDNNTYSYKNNILGSYVHGLFDNKEILTAIIKTIAKNKGIEFKNIKEIDLKQYKQIQYNILADTIRKNVDIDKIYKIIERGI